MWRLVQYTKSRSLLNFTSRFSSVPLKHSTSLLVCRWYGVMLILCTCRYSLMCCRTSLRNCLLWCAVLAYDLFNIDLSYSLGCGFRQGVHLWPLGKVIDKDQEVSVALL